MSNEHQLDYSEWDHLFLCLVLVNEAAGNQNTLYDIIVEIYVSHVSRAGLKQSTRVEHHTNMIKPIK